MSMTLEWLEIEEDVAKNGGINPIGKPLPPEHQNIGKELLYVCDKSYELGRRDAWYAVKSVIKSVATSEHGDFAIGLLDIIKAEIFKK